MTSDSAPEKEKAQRELGLHINSRLPRGVEKAAEPTGESMSQVKCKNLRKWVIFARFFREPVRKRCAAVVLSDKIGDLVVRDERGVA